MTEIYIENKRLDVSQDLESLLTFAVDDVRDFASRNTAFSKTITLPGTANNNTLLGHIFNVTISNFYDAASDNVGTNFNPSVEAQCYIYQNHLQVFKGSLRVLEIIVENGMVEYEVAVFGELSGLVASIGAKRLEDIDFSAYNHTYNIANVTGSWGGNSSGYIYPLIDYAGTSALKADWDVLAFRPAFFIREILDKIFNDSGYTYECDLFDTSRFRTLIMPNNQANLASYSTRAFDADTDIATGPGVYSETPGNDIKLGYNTVNYAGDFTSSLFGTRFTYGGVNQLTCNVRFTIEGDYLTTAGAMYFALVKNGIEIASTQALNNGGSFSFDETFPGVTFSTGDYFEIFAYRQDTALPYSFEVTAGYLRLLTDAVQLVNLNYGEDIDMNSVIPRGIMQKDFLSSIVRLFNLYITEDNTKVKHLVIKPYVDYYDLNVSGVVSWDYKVDRSMPLRLKPMSELNSRYYSFKFKPDGDYYNDLYQKTYSDGFGDYIYDSAYNFANEKTDVEIIFSASPLVGYSGADKIVVAMYKLEAGVEKATATNIRILQTKLMSGVGSWSIKNGVSTLWTGTSYQYAGNYDDPDAPANDIHFGVPRQLYFTLVSGAINVTQFNVYWSPYMAEITDKDSKLLMCYVKLSGADIFNLDFSKLIYIDSAYWRLSKIEDWDASFPGVCRTELLKVLNLVY